MVYRHSGFNIKALKRKLKKANLEAFGWFCLVALVLFSMIIYFPGLRSGASSVFSTAAMWGMEVVEMPLKTFHSFQETKYQENKLLRDADALGKLSNRVETLVAKVAMLEKENSDLRAVLKVSEATPSGYLTVPAIGANTLNTERSLLFLKAGSSQSLREKLPVYFNDQVIGLTQQVTDTSARVVLLNDPSSRVPVCFENTEDQGILTGDGRGGLMIQLRNTNHAIEKGTKVFTAGIGGIFPTYKFIGTVTGCASEIISVKWSVKPERLSYVQVQLTPEISQEVIGDD